MKNLKKVLVVLLALAMTLSMGIIAFADPEETTAPATPTTGTITITNATVGKTYTAYKLFDATVNADDPTDVKIAYTANAAQKAFYEAQAGNPFTFEATSVDGVYNVLVKDTVTVTEDEEEVTKDVDNAYIIGFLQGFVTKDATNGTPVVAPGFAAVISQKATATATDSTVEFTGLPFGYYLVTSTLGAVITLDSTNYAVEVIDKNQEPSEEDKNILEEAEDGTIKRVKENSANFGEPVTFEIAQGVATNYAGDKQITKYTFVDTIENGFDYILDNNDKVIVTVKVGDDTLTADDYTLTYNKDASPRTFTIDIPWVDNDGDSLYASPVAITITYRAALNEAAKIADTSKTGDELKATGNLNKATFTYTTTEGESEPKEHETVTYTYAIAIKKVDTNGNALAGATFALTLNNAPVKVSAHTDDDGNVLWYNYDENGASNEVVSPGYYNNVNRDGIIIIKGVDKGTYTLTEIAAPEGYNLLTSPEQIDAAVEGSLLSSTTIKTYLGADGKVVATETETFINSDVNVPVHSIVVVNRTGTELPSTGGRGTTIIYIAGTVMVLAAAIVFITRRKLAVAK